MTDPVHGMTASPNVAPNLHYLRFNSPQERERYEAAYAQLVATRSRTAGNGRAGRLTW